MDALSAEDTIEAGVYLLSRSRITDRSVSITLPRSIARFRACWATPRSCRVGRYPGDVEPPGPVLDEDQHIQPTQQHGIDVQEIVSQPGFWTGIATVGAFAPIHRSAIAFARGARTGVLITRTPSEANTSSKTLVYFASGSRMRNLRCPAPSPKSMSRFLACWPTPAPVGLVVTPMTWTARVACSMKNST